MMFILAVSIAVIIIGQVNFSNCIENCENIPLPIATRFFEIKSNLTLMKMDPHFKEFKCLLNCLYHGYGIMKNGKLAGKVATKIVASRNECEAAYKFAKYYEPKQKLLKAKLKQIDMATCTSNTTNSDERKDPNVDECFWTCLLKKLGIVKDEKIPDEWDIFGVKFNPQDCWANSLLLDKYFLL